MPTIAELLDEAEAEIRSSRKVDLWRPSDARVNAEEMMGFVIGKEVTSDNLDDPVSASQTLRFNKLVDRRVLGEPVALILGYTEFRNLKLLLKPGVFIPRSSSEFLAEGAIALLRRRKSPVAVDVATGIGPIALAIAKEVPEAQVFGLDIWQPSLTVARSNARRLGLKVKFIKSDMTSKLPLSFRGQVDVFTGHLPYVARKEVRRMASEIRDFEPKVSLTDASKDGLGLVSRMVDEAPQWLSPGGWLLIEVSPDLARSVGTVMRRGGFKKVKSRKDSLGATRVISGKI